MLFNSYDFLFGLLPVVLLGHAWAVRRGPRQAMGWLVAMSLLFYGWWYAPYLLLLLGSIGVNFLLGQRIGDLERTEPARRRELTCGVVLNLALLGWFKYANFLAGNVEWVLGVDLGLPALALPLAISFFTFQQVAYLVDAYKGLTRSHDLLDYSLFVCFFPQLVAGPIVHHDEVLPQFAKGKGPDATDRAVGATMFLTGLAKKVIVADSIAGTTDAVFYATAQGREPTFAVAWTGVVAYHFQLYFDFSGYSDMAIGLARLFGIRLPANFNAPYRAVSVPDFWRRWHITLSRFLRDYVYIPLGGNRHGEGRRQFNLFMTMFLGGIWHGAGWTYVVWGALHGFYLVGHIWWRRLTGGFGKDWKGVAAARFCTTILLLAGWPLFRGEDLDDAFRLLRAMAGLSPEGFGAVNPMLWLVFLGLAVFTQVAPTSQRWMEDYEPVLDLDDHDTVGVREDWKWQPNARWALAVGIATLLAIPLLERADAFLYWNF
jgi:D-alanyl-lipoteichoic acid acyltransferase DltB (MBOAT superfamily)